MNDSDPIEARYSFRLPPLYRELQAAGHFDHSLPDRCLEFTDHWWKSSKAIAEHEFCPWQSYTRNFFVPFSHSARRDEWGWRLDWVIGDEPAVVFCERGPEGRGFAPDFRGFLYRMLLEEFAGTWLLENHRDENGKQMIGRAVKFICPHLPKEWSARIEKLSQQPWYTGEQGSICVYARSDCDRVIAQDLAFPHLDEVFPQEAEDGRSLA